MTARRGMLRAAGKRLEYDWHGPLPGRAPTLVFLHEGLGCRALWRDFPGRIAAANRLGALVYSRAGYGASDPIELPRPLSYHRQEGLQVLPEVVAQMGLGAHVLVGHSDGASIAIVYAGRGSAPGLRALVLIAPHVFNEPQVSRSIAAAREAYQQGDLAVRLRRWHGANTDCAFRGWSEAWLDPHFERWNLEEYLPSVRVPVLVIRGENDEYGTPAQVRAIERKSGGPVEVVLVPDCGHEPQRDRPALTDQAIVRFLRSTLGLGHGGTGGQSQPRASCAGSR